LCVAMRPQLDSGSEEEYKGAFIEELVASYIAMMPTTKRKPSQVTNVYVFATRIATSGSHWGPCASRSNSAIAFCRASAHHDRLYIDEFLDAVV